jgi:hypothetical protein
MRPAIPLFGALTPSVGRAFGGCDIPSVTIVVEVRACDFNPCLDARFARLMDTFWLARDPINPGLDLELSAIGDWHRE